MSENELKERLGEELYARLQESLANFGLEIADLHYLDTYDTVVTVGRFAYLCDINLESGTVITRTFPPLKQATVRKKRSD